MRCIVLAGSSSTAVEEGRSVEMGKKVRAPMINHISMTGGMRKEHPLQCEVQHRDHSYIQRRSHNICGLLVLYTTLSKSRAK